MRIDRPLHVVTALLGFAGTEVALFSMGLAGASILYDTSNIIHHYPEDRYVAAALELFDSAALMFWYVLSLLSEE